MAKHGHPAAAVDLGCGRGEWLELLVSTGFTAHGVDLDEGMLEACKERGLSVSLNDAITHLTSLDDDSQSIVSGFHIIEHIEFERLEVLIAEALRVLQPGGLLIFETPNPENIIVGSNTFYLDPTHKRPIPPELLSFTVQYTGFARSKILRLQEFKKLGDSNNLSLMDVLDGSSPDYAVIAQKNGPKEFFEDVDASFAASYGITIKELAYAYDAQQAQKIVELNSKLNNKFTQFESLLQKHSNFIERISADQKNINSLISSNEYLSHEISKLRSSMSWRITAPLRSAMSVLLNLKKLSPGKFDKSLKNPVVGSNDRSYENRIKIFPNNFKAPDSLQLNSNPNNLERYIRITGHIEGYYSLAIVNRGLASAIAHVRPGKLSFVPYHGKPYSSMPNIEGEYKDALQTAVNNQIDAVPAEHIFSLTHHYPIIFDEKKADVKSLMFFWEETTVPRETVDSINKNFDLVLVASSFVKKSLVDSGCDKPIYTIPLGINNRILEDIAPRDIFAPLKGRKFRFLHVSSAFERKGVDVLLNAYYESFSGDDRVELYIKTFPNPHNTVAQQIRALNKKFKKPPIVVLDEKPITDSEMVALYKSSQVMVLPSRGEGFNLPALEALAIGLPLITTGYGAQVDFCTTETASLVDFDFQLSRSHLRSSDSCWLEPNLEDLKRKMLEIRNDIWRKNPSLKEKVIQASKYVREIYNWKNSAQALWNIANSHKQLQEEFDANRKLDISFVGPWNARCGIAEYNRSLFEKLKCISNFLIYSDDRPQEFAQDVEDTWQIMPGENPSINRILVNLISNPPDILILSHHPGFYGFTDNFTENILSLQNKGVVVIVELHSTIPLLNAYMPSDKSLNVMRGIDRVIVHKPEDLNNILNLGLVDNVQMLPLGIPTPLKENDISVSEIKDKAGVENGALILGSFGFALPHKGLANIIKSLPAIKNELNREVYFFSVNSVLDERSAVEIERCKAIAMELGVSENIKWFSDFLPIDDCQKILAAADYILFPYQHTVESASAAVNVGLASLKPVIVSNQEIFDDMQNVTFRMNGFESSDILNAIISLESNTDLKNELLKKQVDWVSDRQWQVLSDRILNISKSLIRDKKFKSKQF
jgi:glycosyltransferase involved in cell wall biosynthesis/SAM-dependent methyltransferase